MTARDEGRPWARAFAWLAFLAPFFFASYGFATYVSAQRAHVGAMVFDWERQIPFIAWTIVPYWAIDVLYGISLFLSADRRELDTHARRLLTAQVVAVACFLAFPLRFTFERPAQDGVSGWLFDVLGRFDQPYNQAPSLHIALLVILWDLYARKLHGAARVVLHACFALIGVSVLTTWQHHFIDVPTGALLGFLCLWLWPLNAPSPLAGARLTRDRTRVALAARYGAGALGCATIALALGGAWLWLLWIAMSLAIVALGYAALGPAVFQKRGGRLSPAASALLLPYLFGAWLNARAWTGWSRTANRIADGVLLGPLPSRASLQRDGIAYMVDLTAELSAPASACGYAQFPVLDLVAADSATLAAAAGAIEHGRNHGPVLVCCALGLSRSASAVAVWLVATRRAADAKAAIAMLRAAQPRIVLHPAHAAAVDGACAREPA
jgi:membrane-associated phospholipid phosphatase